MFSFLHTLAAALSLSRFRLPKRVKPLRPTAHFWLACCFSLACFCVFDLLWNVRLTQIGLAERLSDSFGSVWLDILVHFWWNLQSVAFVAIASLALSALICALFGKVVMTFSIATLWLISGTFLLLPFALIALWKALFVTQLSGMQSGIALGAITAALWLAYSCTLAYCLGANLALRRSSLAGVSAALLMLLSCAQIFQLEFLLTPAVEELLIDEREIAEPRLAYSPEKVMYRQQKLLEAALANINPGIVDTPELFVLSFGGDSTESVFLNEVSYIQRLFEARFSAQNRVLSLANHGQTTDKIPLATATNLRVALKGLAQKMNPEEDLLFVYLTTHGSKTHELLVQQGPLPLDQIDPKSLGRALDNAGIRYQIVLISACYAGGFIEPLSSANRIIMTASNASQPSFGCGADSDITYFGQAYLVEALNQTHDFVKAFEIAERSVGEREIRMGFEPSKPQINTGAAALLQIRAWKKQIEPGEPVPFFPDPRSR
jgi:hypothetical protein